MRNDVAAIPVIHRGHKPIGVQYFVDLPPKRLQMIVVTAVSQPLAVPVQSIVVERLGTRAGTVCRLPAMLVLLRLCRVVAVVLAVQG
jgi:hypothetical protein